MNIEVMKQALEAWDKWDGGTLDHPLSSAMEALRQAIAEAEQANPVPHCEAGPEHCGQCLKESMPITSRRRSKKAQPLTHEELYDMWEEKYTSWIGGEQFESLARAIEAAHGIKGEA